MASGLINLNIFNHITDSCYTLDKLTTVQFLVNNYAVFFSILFLISGIFIVLLVGDYRHTVRMRLLEDSSAASDSEDDDKRRKTNNKKKKDWTKDLSYKTLVTLLVSVFFIVVFCTSDTGYDPFSADDLVIKSDTAIEDNYSTSYGAHKYEWDPVRGTYVVVEFEDYDSDLDPEDRYPPPAEEFLVDLDD